VQWHSCFDSRVTRLGEISPIRRFLTLGSFLNYIGSPFLDGLFPWKNTYFWPKMGWATFWAIFSNALQVTLFDNLPMWGHQCSIKPLVTILSLKQSRKLFCSKQGCQMVYFKTKNPTLGTFSRAWWEWKMLVHFKAIWFDLWPLGIIYSRLV
jgi:hypothetical protein